MTQKPVCADCGAAMEEGFLLDRAHGENRVSEWVEGTPEYSFWIGAKTHGREKHKVVSWRCGKCGLLKLYTRLE